MTQSPATPLPPPKECRRLREAASLTQAQLASQVGVSRETVRAWENGRVTPRGRKRDTYAKLLARLAGETARQPARGATKSNARPTDATAATLATAAATNGSTDNPTTDPDMTTRQESPMPGRDGSLVLGYQEPPTPVRRASLVPAPPRSLMPAAHQSVTALAVPVAAGADPAETPPVPAPLTPQQAFDALYAFCAPALVRQAFLLCGRRELARESVERAFQHAWQRWPEVAVDPDPAGWVRAAAYDYALSPWHRYRPRHRHPEAPPADAEDRALLTTLLRLPPPHRRTLLLYDGVGLGLAETAAETEASTPATANRLMCSREAIATRLPALCDPVVLHDRLGRLAAAERLRAARPTTVRLGSERRARWWTRTAIACTVALIAATSLTLRTAPTQYEPPVPAGKSVRGVPPKTAPGPLSEEQLELREALREQLTSGPQRLTPEAR